jgi:hypothetical protein
MNTKDSDNNLSRLLSEWKPDIKARPGFEGEVWASIEARRSHGFSAWFAWFKSPSLLSPQYAAAFMAIALVLGGVAGGVYNSKTQHARSDMAGKYLDLIDPLAVADSRQ